MLLTYATCTAISIVLFVSCIVTFLDSNHDRNNKGFFVGIIFLILALAVIYFRTTAFDSDFTPCKEYEVETHKLVSLDYSKNNKISGIFVLGIGTISSDSEEKYGCYVVDSHGEYSRVNFNTRSHKLRLDDSTYPKRVEVWVHMERKTRYSFCKVETEEWLSREVLVVPTNTIKLDFNGNLK